MSEKQIVETISSSIFADISYMENSVLGIIQHYVDAIGLSASNLNTFTKLVDINGHDTEFKKRVRGRRSKRFHPRSRNVPTDGYERWPKAKCKRGFNRVSSTNSGYIDRSIWSQIDRTNPTALPSSIISPRRGATSASDDAAVWLYTRVGRRINSRVRAALAKAAWSAGKQVGIVKKYGNNNFKLLSLTQAVSALIKNTSSGYPTFSKKTNANAIADALNWCRQLYNDKPTSRSIFKTSPVELFSVSGDNDYDPMLQPLTLFHRYQVRESKVYDEWNVKIRQVWCSPFRVLSLECRFFKNIIDHVLDFNRRDDNATYISGISNRDISYKLTRVRRRCMQSNYNYMFSGDYTKFDMNVFPEAYDLFFAVCKTQIVFKGDFDRQVFDTIRVYSKYTPFIHDGYIKFMSQGIVSGSLITSLFGTFVNLLLWHFAGLVLQFEDLCRQFTEGTIDLYSSDLDKLSTAKSGPSSMRLCLCGDDILVVTNLYYTRVFSSIVKCFGFDITFKAGVRGDDDVYFLGRYWDKDSIPWQSEKYMSSHIVYRTKFYRKEDLPFTFSKDKLDLYRILSICLPFKNGLLYLEKTFGDWPPYIAFKKERQGFYLLKDWPHDGYPYVKHMTALDYSWY